MKILTPTISSEPKLALGVLVLHLILIFPVDSTVKEFGFGTTLDWASMKTVPVEAAE